MKISNYSVFGGEKIESRVLKSAIFLENPKT
jgi:hypothetical protein